MRWRVLDGRSWGSGQSSPADLSNAFATVLRLLEGRTDPRRGERGVDTSTLLGRRNYLARALATIYGRGAVESRSLAVALIQSWPWS